MSLQALPSSQHRKAGYLSQRDKERKQLSATNPAVNVFTRKYLQDGCQRYVQSVMQ